MARGDPAASDSIVSGVQQAAVARHRVGQEQLAIVGSHRRGGTSHDEVSLLANWTEIDRLLAGVSAAAKGELGWPPLALFRALLLVPWHDLSDVRLTEALDDRTSFHRLCGFGSHGSTPERTAFARFRGALVRLGLDRALFEAVTCQLDAGGVAARIGTLVDATLLRSASIQRDAEGRWVGHRRRKPVHGTKAHVATHPEAALIRKVEVTTANVHDTARLEAVLPPEPGEVHGDSASASARSDQLILARDSTPPSAQTGVWGRTDALARLEIHDAVPKVRCRIENVLATRNHSYGLR